MVAFAATPPLWIAAVLALVAGIAALAAAIVAVIVLNALFAFVQELQAERATEALQRMLLPRVWVRRAGQAAEVDAGMLVPGDVLLIVEGDRLCADARLLEGFVEVDMASLTGEAQPLGRSANAVTGATQPLLEAEDLVFSGTLCTSGEAEALVYATGMGTQLGRIAALSQRVRPEISPLQRQVNRAAQLIAIVAVGAGIAFLAVGATVAGLPLADASTFAIGLLVANVPEGLLPTITLALAVGVRRMARRRALVKRLTAVETLGSTDVICTDKTGTLTEGRMAVRLLWADGLELAVEGAAPVDGREPFSGIVRTAVRCNNATITREDGGWKRGGDPTESALLLAAARLGEDVELLCSERDGRRLRVHHFDPRLKRMTTLDEEGRRSPLVPRQRRPLELLERCSTVRGRSGDRNLSAEQRNTISAARGERRPHAPRMP
jgi:magnesium-transporting ATPase (P-type)